MVPYHQTPCQGSLYIIYHKRLINSLKQKIPYISSNDNILGTPYIVAQWSTKVNGYNTIFNAVKYKISLYNKDILYIKH